MSALSINVHIIPTNLAIVQIDQEIKAINLSNWLIKRYFNTVIYDTLS